MDFKLTPAQEALRLRARELADGTFRERAARWDAQEQYPWDNVKDLVRAGFMGLTIPREYAGPAASILDVLLVVEEIARVCGVTARIVVEGSLGVVGALAAYGSEAQKRRYFPWVLDGDKPAIAITEPEAGSAATDMVTRADEAPEGYALHGEKRWITGAGTSRLYLVYCRMSRAAGAAGIGGIFLERDTPGFRIGDRDHTMGLRGIPEGRLHFDGCRVPKAQRLGEAGQGFKLAMRTLDIFRTSVAAAALGCARRALDDSVASGSAARIDPEDPHASTLLDGSDSGSF